MSKLQEFVDNPKKRKAYQEWRSLPMTQEMKELADELSGPGELSTIDGNHALLAHGQQVGFVHLKAMLFKLPDYKTMKEAQDKISDLQSDYGYEKILAEEGITKLKETDDGQGNK